MLSSVWFKGQQHTFATKSKSEGKDGGYEADNEDKRQKREKKKNCPG